MLRRARGVRRGYRFDRDLHIYARSESQPRASRCSLMVVAFYAHDLHFESAPSSLKPERAHKHLVASRVASTSSDGRSRTMARGPYASRELAGQQEALDVALGDELARVRGRFRVVRTGRSDLQPHRRGRGGGRDRDSPRSAIAADAACSGPPVRSTLAG